jgi:hypothetical protein
VDPRHYFAEPVAAEDAPGYYDVITQPMCFAVVRQRLAEGRYTTLDALCDDLALIVRNAMAFNAPDTKFYRAAQRVEDVLRRATPMVRRVAQDTPPYAGIHWLTTA